MDRIYPILSDIVTKPMAIPEYRDPPVRRIPTYEEPEVPVIKTSGIDERA